MEFEEMPFDARKLVRGQSVKIKATGGVVYVDRAMNDRTFFARDGMRDYHTYCLDVTEVELPA